MAFDELDRRIVAALVEDGRATYAEIGARVGLSAPAVKRRAIVAFAACILADRQVTVRESELLRAVCDTLDCPLPPLVVGEAEGR